MNTNNIPLPPPMPFVDIPPAKKWVDSIETFLDLQNADLPDPEWLVDKMIPKPGLVAITGRFGSYKTWFVQWMLERLSAGLPLFDKWNADAWFTKPPIKPVNVLFIEEEMSRRQIKKRITNTKSFGDGRNFLFAVSGGFNLQDEKIVAELKEIVIARNIDVIALDPFTSVSKMKDENSNSEAAKIMDILRHTFVDSDLEKTVLFIHHPSKADNDAKGIRGAGDILGKCDMHFTIEIKEREVDYAKILIECGKTRYEPVPSWYAELQKDEKDLYQRLEWVFGGIKEQTDSLNEQDMTIVTLMKYHKSNGKTMREISEILQINRTSKRFVNLWKIAEK